MTANPPLRLARGTRGNGVTTQGLPPPHELQHHPKPKSQNTNPKISPKLHNNNSRGGEDDPNKRTIH